MSPDLINTLGVWLEIVVTAFGAMLFALWAGTLIWTFNDIRARSWDWAVIALAVGLVAVVPFVGLVGYLLVRPKETLADTYDRALEEEALLRDMDAAWKCGQCSLPVKEEWIYCPQCRTQLQYSCRTCGQNIRTDWQHCAYCGMALKATSPTDAASTDRPEGTMPAVGTPDGQRPASAAVPGVGGASTPVA